MIDTLGVHLFFTALCQNALKNVCCSGFMVKIVVCIMLSLDQNKAPWRPPSSPFLSLSHSFAMLPILPLRLRAQPGTGSPKIPSAAEAWLAQALAGTSQVCVCMAGK